MAEIEVVFQEKPDAKVTADRIKMYADNLKDNTEVNTEKTNDKE